MITLLLICSLLLLLFARVPVAFVLGGLGLTMLWCIDINLIVLPQRLYGTMDSFELLAIPMFLLMSNILLKANMGKELFTAVQSWVGHWPGGLAIASIFSCGIFSAISGSSVATAATIGTIALPEMTKRGYHQSFSLGVIAAGGTLGILIPPSIPLIIFGVITEESIPTLFLAGIGPGILLTILFACYSIIVSKNSGYQPTKPASWKVRLNNTLIAFPVILLAISIIGSIYTGVATPTESAAIGFVCALVLTVSMRRINYQLLINATMSAMKTTLMIFMIIAGANIFSYAITVYQIPQDFTAFVTNHFTQPHIFIIIVGLLLLFIGFFIESISILLIMTPILLPSITNMAIDPVWFGIFFVILIEIALVTPPVGLNLFVIQAITNTSLFIILRGIWPFISLMMVLIILLWFIPSIVLYIPSL